MPQIKAPDRYRKPGTSPGRLGLAPQVDSLKASKIQLKRKLDPAWSRVRSQARDSARARDVYARVRQPKLYLVERVQKIAPELQPPDFAEIPLFAERQVPVL